MKMSSSFSRGRLMVVPARIRHRSERKSQMLLDTGARLSVITPKLAEELGFEPHEMKPTTTAVGANGTFSVALLTVPSVSVDHVEVPNLRMICHALPPELVFQGILGLDFLSHFNIEINNQSERVSLTRWTAQDGPPR